MARYQTQFNPTLLVQKAKKIAFFCIAPWLLFFNLRAENLVIYPKINHPQFLYEDDAYSMTVDGQNVPIRNYDPRHRKEAYERELPIDRERKNDPEYKKTDLYKAFMTAKTRDYYYAQFSIGSKPVAIEIDAKENINSFTIRPQIYKIQAKVNGSKLSFTLDSSRYLSVEINDRKDLFVLADPSENDQPASSGVDKWSKKKVFNIGQAPYSADAKGKNMATEAIKKAFEDASKEGGIVYVPAGTYVTNRFSLKSKVWLYLEAGAVLVANPDRRVWRNSYTPDVMINCGSVNDSKVYGRGVIFLDTTAINAKLAELKKSEPKEYENLQNLRLRPFEIRKVSQFIIDGITVNESSAWTTYIQSGSNITISNYKVLNDKCTGTNDGINCGGGQNIHVRHCFVSTLDDSVCLKGYMSDVNTVLIEDMVADSARSSLKFGLQANRPIVNITVKNFHGIRGGKGFDICHDAGQEDYRNIHILDSTFDRCDGYPLRAIIRDKNSKGAWPRGVGSVVGIQLERVEFRLTNPDDSKMTFSGYDNNNVIRDIRFQDVTINGNVLTAADFGKNQSVVIGPYVLDVLAQGKAVELPPKPPEKKAVKDPPPSKSRAGKAWEEKSGVSKEIKEDGKDTDKDHGKDTDKEEG